MKKLFWIGVTAALCAGCAHDEYQGGVDDDRRSEAGYEHGSGTYGPPRPLTPLERDFPERIEPGATGEPRINPLTPAPVPQSD